MDATVQLSMVGGALLLSIILVSSLCTYCWGHKQPTSIHQRTSDSSPEYNPTFVVRHPQSTYAPHPDQRIGGLSYPLANSLSSPSITVTKVPSCPPSETGSQASYVNQDNEELPYVQPPSDYIIVLPDSPTAQTHASRASSQSSGGECYINIEKEDGNVSEDTGGCVVDSDSESDSHAYENFRKSPDLRSQTCGLSCGSLSSDERGSSDYVNTDLHTL